MDNDGSYNELTAMAGHQARGPGQSATQQPYRHDMQHDASLDMSSAGGAQSAFDHRNRSFEE